MLENNREGCSLSPSRGKETEFFRRSVNLRRHLESEDLTGGMMGSARDKTGGTTLPSYDHKINV